MKYSHDVYHDDLKAFDYTDRLLSRSVSAMQDEWVRMNKTVTKTSARTSAEIAADLENKSIKKGSIRNGDFWKNIDKDGDNGCWNWTGNLFGGGYGQVIMGRKTYQAHRISWIEANGKIPEGLYVCHKCDNKKCVNPDHLFIGSQLDNMQDMVSKGRSTKGIPRHYNAGENSIHSKLTNEQVLEIRSIYPKVNMTELGRRYGVSYHTISDLLLRKSWKHI